MLLKEGTVCGKMKSAALLCASMFKKGSWLTQVIFLRTVQLDVQFPYSFSLSNLDWREKIAVLIHQEGIYSEVDEWRRKKGEGGIIV